MKNHYKFWIIISLIVVFVGGGVAGILLEKHILPTKIKRTRGERRSVRFPTLDVMAKELDLTSEQVERIREIFQNNEEKLKDLRSYLHKSYSEIRSQLKNNIIDVLTEDQKVKFESMIAKYLEQRKEEMERRKKHRKENGRRK